MEFISNPIPVHDVDAETAEWKATQPANHPLPEFSMTPGQAISAWMDTLSRTMDDMARIPATDAERELTRKRLHELIDQKF